MIKEDIRKLYHRLCKDFTYKPFDEVLNEIREIIKKYYSCFPLLLQMGILMINHYDTVKEQKRKLLIDEALELFIHIQEMSKEIEICRQAKCMQATCYILLSQPAQVIDLLHDSNFSMPNETILLAQGQIMNGQSLEAKKTLQIGIYQTIMLLIQNLMVLLQTTDISQTKEIEQIENRILTVSNIFEMESLSPATMLSIYLTQAQIYLAHKEEETALTALQKYADLATSDIFPLTLHGDTFFNEIDKWLSELSLGIEAPRANITIKADIAAAVKNNPIFSSLNENVKYKFIIDKLSLLEK